MVEILIYQMNGIARFYLYNCNRKMKNKLDPVAKLFIVVYQTRVHTFCFSIVGFTLVKVIDREEVVLNTSFSLFFSFTMNKLVNQSRKIRRNRLEIYIIDFKRILSSKNRKLSIYFEQFSPMLFQIRFVYLYTGSTYLYVVIYHKRVRRKYQFLSQGEHVCGSVITVLEDLNLYLSRISIRSTRVENASNASRMFTRGLKKFASRNSNT